MKRKRHSPEQIITKLREADAILAAGAKPLIHAASTPPANDTRNA